MLSLLLTGGSEIEYEQSENGYMRKTEKKFMRITWHGCLVTCAKRLWVPRDLFQWGYLTLPNTNLEDRVSKILAENRLEKSIMTVLNCPIFRKTHLFQYIPNTGRISLLQSNRISFIAKMDVVVQMKMQIWETRRWAK